MKLCINCDTENPVDAVFCSECGMSLTSRPTGQSAEKARSVAAVPDDTGGEEKGIPRATLAALVWTGLVATAGFCAVVGAPCLFIDAGPFEAYHSFVNWSCGGALALATAPWIGLILVRWWRSRASGGPEAIEPE